MVIMVQYFNSCKTRRGGRIDVIINVHRFDVRLDKLAVVANVLPILLLQNVNEILIGEIPTEIEVLGTKRYVDIYGKSSDFELYGEIERDRETLQVEMQGLKEVLEKQGCRYKLAGFLVEVKQDFDKELLWQVTVKSYKFNEIPIYRVHIVRGLTWIE
jgi:hypothetical protein